MRYLRTYESFSDIEMNIQDILQDCIDIGMQIGYYDPTEFIKSSVSLSVKYHLILALLDNPYLSPFTKRKQMYEFSRRETISVIRNHFQSHGLQGDITMEESDESNSKVLTFKLKVKL